MILASMTAYNIHAHVTQEHIKDQISYIVYHDWKNKRESMLLNSK